MNEYLHTAIALSFMYGSFISGRYLGRKEGWTLAFSALMDCWNVKVMEIDKEGDVVVTKQDGTEKIVKVN